MILGHIPKLYKAMSEIKSLIIQNLLLSKPLECSESVGSTLGNFQTLEALSDPDLSLYSLPTTYVFTPSVA